LIVNDSNLAKRLLLQALTVHQRFDLTGKGVCIAVIDTGFHSEMLEIKSEPIKTDNGILEKAVLNPEDDSEDPHADAVTAIMHAIAPDASFMNIRVASSAKGAPEGLILQAINLAIDQKRKHGIPHILNISLGTKNLTPKPPFFSCDGSCKLCRAIDSAAEANLLTVVSAGNYGANPFHGPITCPGASKTGVTVGSASCHKINKGKFKGSFQVEVSSFSSWGPVQATWRKPNILAPGAIPVKSSFTFLLMEYVPEIRLQSSQSGTSFAVPFVSGAAALIMQIVKAPNKVKHSMYLSAEDLELPEIKQGSGLLNIVEAIKFALKQGERI
jgi:subtilisin family serine protease